MKYLIAGLGNIGPEYELTRHNIGFLVLDQLADKFNATFTTRRLGDIADIRYKGRSLTLLKPSTYMNLSGKAIGYWLNELKVERDNLLVIVDEVALPFGSLRMRGKGSSAGHNGLNSIEATLETQQYARLRFGIGNDFPRGHQVDFVLSNFSPEEFQSLPAVIDKAVEMILSFTTQGIDRTMSQYNT